MKVLKDNEGLPGYLARIWRRRKDQDRDPGVWGCFSPEGICCFLKRVENMLLTLSDAFENVMWLSGQGLAKDERACETPLFEFGLWKDSPEVGRPPQLSLNLSSSWKGMTWSQKQA